MTANLDSESRNSLVKYRINRAYETLKEADYTAKGGFYNSAVNRLYYSAFYATNALLISRGIVCETHRGVKTMLAIHFINNGILEEKYGKILNILFQNRQTGDYEDFIYCDAELYNELRPKAEEFVKAINTLL